MTATDGAVFVVVDVGCDDFFCFPEVVAATWEAVTAIDAAVKRFSSDSETILPDALGGTCRAVVVRVGGASDDFHRLEVHGIANPSLDESGAFVVVALGSSNSTPVPVAVRRFNLMTGQPMETYEPAHG